MEEITRYYQNIMDYSKPNKVLALFGPRQVGKTTLVRKISLKISEGINIKYDTGDDYRIQEVWNSQNLSRLKEYVEGYDTVIIDEAQRISGIGLGLKLLVDAKVSCSFIVTGSSSFALAGQIGEPLTGRKRTLMLYPVAQLELLSWYNRYELAERMEQFLLYGSYPEVITATSRNDKIEYLNEITGSYLLKDILELEQVKGAKVLFDLLRLLAHQIGNEVSLRELGNSLGIDYKTVARYIDLMEKSFILYNLRGFSGNLRKEVTKKSKYYFFDPGIRNAIIANFNPLEQRNDTGALWENFIFMERMKKAAYYKIYRNAFFWRTWDKQEIDLIEEREGKLFAYEIKYGKKPSSPPTIWKDTYPDSEFALINRKNYLDFILP
jgi:uncharacterized protein